MSLFPQANLYNPDLPIVKRLVTPRSNARSKIDMSPFPCFMLSRVRYATQLLIALWREAHRPCAVRSDPRRHLWR